jgi:FkbM family methyltransferase
VKRELEAILSEDVDEVKRRERAAFDLAGGRADELVLFGAGGLGRRTLAGLRHSGVEPLAFADNSPGRIGTTIDGIPVLGAADAAQKYGDRGTFVVTIWGALPKDRMQDRVAQLVSLGCKNVLTFGQLYWKYPDFLLPHYGADLPHLVTEQRESVLAAANLWADEASRREYLRQLMWRLTMDFDGLSMPVAHPIYFPDDLYKLKADEAFVDCGAFDGDTIDLFIAQSENRFQSIVGFEPDPANFMKLNDSVGKYAPDLRDKITLHNTATGSAHSMTRFAGDGLPSSAMGSGDIEIEVVALDDVISDVTYLKMDIEGAEIDTLKGAEGLIRAQTPVLAICCYHRQDHLWKVPLLIHSMNDNYRFFLRPHDIEMWDLVCYAIPKDRLVKVGR